MKEIAYTIVITLLLGAGAWGAATEGADAAAPELTLQTVCPIMGGRIDKDLYVDHEGQRIYVCCEGCIDAVKKDPAKAIRTLEDAGVTVARLQTVCPIMGGKIDRKLYVDHEGQRIYVCCAACIAPLKQDPAKHVEAMTKAGIALAATPKPGKATEAAPAPAEHTEHPQ